MWTYSIVFFCTLLGFAATALISRDPTIREKRQAPSGYYYGLGGQVIGAYTPVGLAYNPLRVAALTNWGRKKREINDSRSKRTPSSYSGIEANLVEQVAAISDWGRRKRSVNGERKRRQAPSAYYYGPGGQVIGAFTPFGLAYNPLRVAALTNWG